MDSHSFREPSLAGYSLERRLQKPTYSRRFPPYIYVTTSSINTEIFHSNHLSLAFSLLTLTHSTVLLRYCPSQVIMALNLAIFQSESIQIESSNNFPLFCLELTHACANNLSTSQAAMLVDSTSGSLKIYQKYSMGSPKIMYLYQFITWSI
jgi:hypothetical protein